MCCNWHKIKKGERRPKGLVLLFHEGSNQEMKLINSIYGPYAQDHGWEIHGIVLARWRNGAWRQIGNGWIIQNATHWMPLPEPPEHTEAA